MLELTDENFEREINNSQKPVLVDFFAEWCTPCAVLGPILENIALEFGREIVFLKADLNNVPLIAQKFGIDTIPAVILFKEGKPADGFVGLRSEVSIKKWLEEKLKNTGGSDNTEKIIEECEEYARKNGFKVNPNREIAERTVKGLLENEKKYGKRYCPCRRIKGIAQEDAKNICPCVYHRQEIEESGRCLCGLFVKE